MKLVSMRSVFLPFILLLLLVVGLGNAVAQTTYYSLTSGNWNANATWSTVSHTGPAATAFPVAGDDAIIGSNHTVTIFTNTTYACSNLTITDDGILNFTQNRTLSVASNLTLDNNAQITVSAGSNTRIINVGGIFNVLNTGTNTVVGDLRLNISGSGPHTINGQLTLNGNTAIKIFAGNVDISNSGTWVSTNITNTANLIFRNGITNNGIFTAGGATFNTNATQSIGGITPMSFSGIVTVAAGITLTNSNTDVVTLSNSGVVALASGGAGSTFTQGINSTLNYAGSSIGVVNFNATANPNTVNYFATAGQTVRATTYHNLVLSGSGNKSMGAMSIAGSLTVMDNANLNNSAVGTIAVSGDLIIDGTGRIAPATADAGKILTVSGTFSVLPTATNAIIGGLTLRITGAGPHTNAGTLTFNSNTGVKRLDGQVINTGNWTSTNLTTNLFFRNGISNVGGTFTAGGATFNTNDQNIGGNAPMSFSGIVTVDAGITLTNNNTNTVTLSNAGVALANVAGTFTQGTNSTLHYAGSSMGATLNLEASASGNTINYTLNTGNPQAIKLPTTSYYNLILSGSGNKTVASPGIAISEELSISGAAVALLSNGTNSTTNTLTLSGLGAGSGSWGGATSTAINKSLQYFGTGTTGLLNVVSSTCTTPDVTDFNAVSATDVCGDNGSLVTVSSTSLADGVYSVTYNISGDITVGSTLATLTVSSGTGTFTTVNLTNPSIANVVNIESVALPAIGCVSNVAVSSPPFATNPIPTIALNTETEDVCFSPIGQTTTLTYTATTNSPTLYSIDFNAAANAQGFVDVVNVPLTISPIIINIPAGAIAATYNAVLTVSTGFCVSTGSSFSITINPLPTPTFTAQPAIACVGEIVTYSTESGFSGSYIWGFSAPHTIITGGTISDNSVELQWLTAGSKTVTINYIDGNGCTAVAPTTSSPTIVNSAIPATPGVITGSNEHCEGTVDLIYSITPVAGADSYTWSVPTDWVITLDNGTSITASAPLLSASGNIEVTATNGCGVSAASILPVTVNPLPVPYNVGGGGTYCAGDAGHAVTLSGSELDVNYQLERNGVDVGSPLTGTNSALSFGLQTITGTYTVTATNTITGCIQTMAGSTSIAVNTVTAGTFPNPASICVGGTANLTFTDNGQRTPGAAVTYRWKYSVDNITFNTIEPPTFSELPSFATYTTFPLTTAGNHYFKRVVISTLNGIPCEAEGSAITVNVGSGQPPIRTDEEGLWHTAATWTTGSIPAINDGTTGCPVTVSHNLTIESNLVVNAGVVAISANVTDADGGPSVNLLMDKSPANFSFTQGILEIRSGATVRLQGTALLKTTTLIIRKGGKLVIGPRELEVCNCWSDFEPGATPGDPDACNAIGDESYREAVRFTIDKNARVIIEDGAYLIVYGSVSMPDPQTELSVNGEFIVTGNFATTTGSVSIVQDIPGEGDLYTCGTLTTQGSGEIFGTTNDCTETSEFANPPCQASTLSCTFSAFITPGGTSVWCNDVQLEANTNASPLALLKWEYYDEDNTQWIPAPDLVGDINYSLTPDNPPVDEDALYRIRVNSASCTKFSSAVRIRYGTNAWRGNTTNSSYPTLPRSAKPYDWNDQVNWCNNVPLGSENIEITSGTPIIYEGNVALVNNLILGEDAFLSFQQYVAGPDQPELNIFGNFTNYGEIDALVGEVKFTGVDNGNYIETNPLQPGSFNFNTLTFEKPVQLNTGVGLNIRGNLNIVSGVTMDLTYTRINLNGNVAGTQQVNINNNVLSNLTINKAAGNVQFISMALLGGIPYDQTRPFNGGLLSILTPTTVNANGNLTIRSIGIDYKTDGSIGTMHSGASVTGNVRVQRYMDAVPNAPFRYISSAVDSDPKPPQVDKLLYYDNGWKGASTMLNGVGYTALTYTGSAATFSVRGIVGQKNFTWSTANGKLKPGWNLIGNPYPSAIQWAQSLTDTRWIVDWNNVATLIAITDNSFAGYPNYFRYYDFTDPGFSLPEYVDENGDNATWGQDVIQDGVIVMGQAFWVYASNGASITLTESAKTSPSDGRDGEFYRKKSNMKADSELLTISITNGTQGDQAYLRINPDASHEFDFNLDFPKFKNVGMNLYLQDSMDSSMLILSLPEVSENAPIPLGIEFTEPGEYTISFSDDGKFSYRSKLFLIDQYDGVAVPISTSEPFSFSIPEGSSTLQDRFYLSLTPELKLNKETSVSVYPNPVNDLLNIQVIGLTGTSSATLIDMNGKILISSDFKGDGIIDMKDYPEGMYVLKVKTENGILTKKIVKY